MHSLHLGTEFFEVRIKFLDLNMSLTPYVLYSVSVRAQGACGPPDLHFHIKVLGLRTGIFSPPTNITRDVGGGVLIYQRTLAELHI